MSYHFCFRYNQLQSGTGLDWTGEFVIAKQRAISAYAMLCQNYVVLEKKLILLWVENFRTIGSSIKRKPPRKPQCA